VGPEPADAALLQAFVERRDGPAFAALVRRHGPMVLGVCCRVLGNHHDAEDAFQATFLVLARKAASVVPRETVGNWLYGVAYRTALEARSLNARRRTREQLRADPPERPCPPGEPADERLQSLDDALSRLPDRYRVPVVLCELEGRPRKEVAHHLGVPEGTLSSRLAAARKLLAKRLARHDPRLTAPVVGALFAEASAPAAVPTVLSRAAELAADGVAVAPAAVSALAEGVLKAMLLNRMKAVAGMVLALAVVAAGVAARAYPPPGPPGAPPREETPPTVRGGGDRDAIQGVWNVVSVDRAWLGMPEVQRDTPLVVISGERLAVRYDGGVEIGEFDLYPTLRPKGIDVAFPDRKETYPGAYQLAGDELALSLSQPGNRRPADVTAGRSRDVVRLVLRREPGGGPIEKQQAEKDFNLGRFYERIGHPASARFCYQLVCRRYPGTPRAEEAARRLKALTAEATEGAAPSPGVAPVRVGQVFIVGNEKTPQASILALVPLYPGQVLTYADLRTGEQNLKRLFNSATVSVINAEAAEGAFRDVLIAVQEEGNRGKPGPTASPAADPRVP
jgi:RNA polymerase sigma factor (sigma-70 family)